MLPQVRVKMTHAEGALPQLIQGISSDTVLQGEAQRSHHSVPARQRRIHRQQGSALKMPDYTPERGPLPDGIDIAHGIIQVEHKGQANSVTEALSRRLAPHGRGSAPAYYAELLIPPTAPDLLTNIDTLLKLYDDQRLPEQKDLLGITTLRFDHTVTKHVAFELVRGWARKVFIGRHLATNLVQHVPALAGRSNKQHVHCLWFVRQLHGSTFGAFSDLTKPGARAILAADWASWLADTA